MFLFLFNWGLFPFSSMLLFCFGFFFVFFLSLLHHPYHAHSSHLPAENTYWRAIKMASVVYVFAELTNMCYVWMYICLCVRPGLVPESTFQRETHETAERAGRPEARVFPEPEKDEDAGGPAGARGAAPQRALLLLWRYGKYICIYVSVCILTTIEKYGDFVFVLFFWKNLNIFLDPEPFYLCFH